MANNPLLPSTAPIPNFYKNVSTLVLAFGEKTLFKLGLSCLSFN
jgi:hypothetical protein